MNFLASDFINDIYNRFYTLCLAIDSILYKLIYHVFNFMMTLSEIRLFSSDVIGALTRRAYSIIGVVMLFVLAYSLLRLIINPEDLVKGKNSGFSIAKRIVISLCVIVFTPAIFDFAYGAQYSIVSNNVIGKTVMGGSSTIESAAGEFTALAFSTNFYPSSNASSAIVEEYDQVLESVKYSGDISDFNILVPYATSGEITYHNIISIIVSGIMLYVIFTFCFDMATRIVKLAFLQMIAPVPAIMNILPTNNGSLSKWGKEVFNSFLQVVIRIFILYFIMFLFITFNKGLNDGIYLSTYTTKTVKTYGFINIGDYVAIKLFVIFGLLAFLKQAPKLINDLFGIKTEGNMFSLKSKWNDVTDMAKQVATPFNKILGAGAGVVAANVAYEKGIKNGNKDTQGRRASAVFNGLRNGFRGGVTNVGNAYDYEYESQLSYARNADKSDAEVLFRSKAEHLAKGFGFETPYEYGRRDIQMKSEVEMAKLRTENRKLDEQKRGTDRALNRIYNVNEKDNQDALTLLESFESDCESFVKKASSKRKKKIDLADYYASFDDKITKKQNRKTQLLSLTSRSEKQELELSKIDDDISDLTAKRDLCGEVFASLHSHLSPEDLSFNGNFSELENLKSSINLRQDMSETEKQVMSQLIGGLQKEIKLEHEADVMTRVIRGDTNIEDSKAASSAQQLQLRLESTSSQIGKSSQKVDKGVLKEIVEKSPEKAEEIQKSFEIASDTEVQKFRDKLSVVEAGTEDMDTGILKDLGDELKYFISKTQMNKSSSNAEAEYTDLDGNVISGIEADARTKRNTERINELQEDIKNYELSHINDKEISDSNKKKEEISRRNIHKAKPKQ